MPLWSIQEQTFNDEASQLSFTFTSIPENIPATDGSGEWSPPAPSTCVLIVGNGARSRELVIMFDRGGFKVKSDVVDGSWAPDQVNEPAMPSFDERSGPPEVYAPLPEEAYKLVVPQGPDPAPINELAKILGL